MNLGFMCPSGQTTVSVIPGVQVQSWLAKSPLVADILASEFNDNTERAAVSSSRGEMSCQHLWSPNSLLEGD